MVCTQKPRIQVSEHNVDHWEMLIRFSLITSDWLSYVPVAQLVQIVVASPPIGSHFRARVLLCAEDAGQMVDSGQGRELSYTGALLQCR